MCVGYLPRNQRPSFTIEHFRSVSVENNQTTAIYSQWRCRSEEGGLFNQKFRWVQKSLRTLIAKRLRMKQLLHNNVDFAYHSYLTGSILRFMRSFCVQAIWIASRWVTNLSKHTIWSRVSSVLAVFHTPFPSPPSPPPTSVHFFQWSLPNVWRIRHALRFSSTILPVKTHLSLQILDGMYLLVWPKICLPL